MNQDTDSLMEYKVDFKKGTPNPEKVFEAMRQIIAATQQADQSLLGSVSGSIAPVLVLDSIEIGSLVSKVRSTLNLIDDEALKSGDCKKIIGHFLFRAKHYMLSKLPEEDGKTLTKDEIIDVQTTVVEIAEETGVRDLPFFHVPQANELAHSMADLHHAATLLDSSASLSFRTPEGDYTPLNPKAEVTRASVDAQMAGACLENDVTALITVKKPDYIGKSQWDFLYDNHVIQARITDLQWLEQFQSRKLNVRPGDSLNVTLRVSCLYGIGSEILKKTYQVLKVNSVEIQPTHTEFNL